MKSINSFITSFGLNNEQLGSQMSNFAMLYVISKITGHTIGITPSQLTAGHGQQIFYNAFDSPVVLLQEERNINYVIPTGAVEEVLNISEIASHMNIQYNYAFAGLFHCNFLYFLSSLQDMRNDFFVFKQLHIQQGDEWLSLNRSTSKKHASVHFRRTDYLINAAANCSLDYYKNSLSHLDPDEYKLFIFSDDIDYCKENRDIFEKYEVSFSEKNTQFVDMYIMTKCDANIIANSSFSVWGALLNKQNNLMICPENMLPLNIDFPGLLKPHKSHIFITNPYISKAV
jgi:hypothetical protein